MAAQKKPAADVLQRAFIEAMTVSVYQPSINWRST
jgi:hypothetical protein